MIKVKEYERALKFVKGEFKAVLKAGRYFAQPLANVQFEIYDVRQLQLKSEHLDFIWRNRDWATDMEIVKVLEGERGILKINGRVVRFLEPGIHAYWTVFEKVEQMIFDARSMALSGKMVTDCFDVDHDDNTHDEVVAAGYGIYIEDQKMILFSDAHNYLRGTYVDSTEECKDVSEKEYALPDGYRIIHPEVNNFVYVPPDAVFTNDSAQDGPYILTLQQLGVFEQKITIGQAGIPERENLTSLP